MARRPVSLEVMQAELTAERKLDKARWESHHHEHTQAADTQKSADTIADKALESYKATANEFRGSLSDQARSFVTRQEHEVWGSRLTALENDRIARDAEDRAEQIAKSERQERERQDRARQQWTLGIVVAAASIIVSSVVALILRLIFG